MHLVPWTVRQFVRAQLPLWLYRELAAHDVTTLCYHFVAEERPAHIRHLYACKTPAQFAADLDYLQRHYRPVSYAEVAAARESNRRLPRGAALLTIDDGYRPSVTTIAPALRARRMPAVLFIPTDLIDNRAMLLRNRVSLCVERLLQSNEDAWPALRNKLTALGQVDASSRDAAIASLRQSTHTDSAHIERLCDLLSVNVAAYLADERPYLTSAEIRQLAAAGFTIGAHGTDHTPLGSRPDFAALEREIVTSCGIVRDLVGCDHVPFAFPYHADGVPREWLAEIRRRHDGVGLLFDSRWLRRDPPFIVQRIMADAPRGACPGRSNLPGKLRDSYQRELAARGRARRQAHSTGSGR